LKIALIGSAPSSVALAPYDDPEWKIWACSPGATSSLKRVDAFFEIHRYQPHDTATWYPEYVGWMRAQTCPVYMIEAHPDFPASVAFPVDAMIERFGRNFWTSSLAWMMALAIVEVEGKAGAEIALYGVDMAATDEYGHQKPGCLYFIEIARSLGITVTIPPESDLDRPLPLYGIGEANPMRIKLTMRKAELDAKIAETSARAEKANREFEAAHREMLYFRGASEDVQYMLNTWCP
jgi:hypothetical protein